jgi:adenosylmethionine-8-amino-7-oxononanoate aminotransferase
VRDRRTREEYPYDARAGQRACTEARPLGAILRPLGNVVVLMPPLAMTDDELGRLAGIAHEAIDRATAKLDRELARG